MKHFQRHQTKETTTRIAAKRRAAWCSGSSLCLLLLIGAARCGAGSGSAKEAPSQPGLVAAEATPGVDSTDPRIDVAHEAIEQLLGHPLTLQVDEALVRQFGDGLHEQYVSALETLVAALTSNREQHPEVFAFAGPKFQHVVFNYSPAGDSPTLDIEGATLLVPVAPEAEALLEPYVVSGAFRTAHSVSQAKRFVPLDPGSVPYAEQLEYLRFIRDYVAPDTPRERRVVVRVERIGTVIAFERRASHPEAKKEATSWLVQRGLDLRRTSSREQKLPELAKAADAVRKQWVDWMNTRLTSLDSRDQERVARAFFISQSSHGGVYARLDLASFGYPLVRAWAKQPNVDDLPRQSDARRQAGTQRTVACPYQRDSFRKTFQRRGACNGAFYRAALKRGDGPRRLARLLSDAAAPHLTESAVLNVLHLEGATAGRELLDRLVKSAQLEPAMLALADARWRSRPRAGEPALDPAPLVSAVPGYWKAAPKTRAALLYFLVRVNNARSGSVEWGGLASKLGAPIGPRELSAYLALQPWTLEGIDHVALALGKDWSRAEVIIPKVEQYLDRWKTEQRGTLSPHYTLERVVRALCRSPSSRDLDALKAALAERMERFPSEERHLKGFVKDTNKRLCHGINPAPRGGEARPPRATEPPDEPHPQPEPAQPDPPQAPEPPASDPVWFGD